MPDEIRYTPREEIIERERLNAGSSPGGGGGGQGSSGGNASSGGSSSSNESRENPAYTGRGDSRNNATSSRDNFSPTVDNLVAESQEQPRQRSRSEGQPNQFQGSQSQKEESMTYCPPMAFGATAPYGFNPYFTGYGVPPVAPVAPASNIVVAGATDQHGGIHSQLETLSDVALGGLRESAATGRTNQLSTQIESIGDRIDNQSSFNRELTVQKQFTDAAMDRGNLKSDLLNAVKEEAIRTRELFTSDRMRALEGENANLRDARRDDRLLEVLQDIRRSVARTA